MNSHVIILDTCHTFPIESKWKAAAAAGGTQAWVSAPWKVTWTSLISLHLPLPLKGPLRSLSLSSLFCRRPCSAQRPLSGNSIGKFVLHPDMQNVQITKFSKDHIANGERHVLRTTFSYVQRLLRKKVALPSNFLCFFSSHLPFCIHNDQQTVSNMLGNYTEMSISLTLEDTLCGK